ncbi:MAG: HPr kinase/phosphatase C-terminal domain-containing protein [Pseudomonadota bacterium]
MKDAPRTVHGTAVAYQEHGILLTGPSGSGKSALAMQLLSRGAALIADDRVTLTPVRDRVKLSCPSTISGLIEVRGIGILNAHPVEEAFLSMVVDLGQRETERVPDNRFVCYFGLEIPLLRRVDGPHFAEALLHLLAHGRSSR